MSYYNVTNNTSSFQIVDNVNLAPGQTKNNVFLNDNQLNIFVLAGLTVTGINDSVNLPNVALANSSFTDGTNPYILRQTLNSKTGALTSVFYNLDGSVATPDITKLKISEAGGTGVSTGSSVLGTLTDTPATSNTGSWSISSLIRYGLSKWDSLLAKIPASVNGRIPVDGSGVTQPVSIAGQSGNVTITGSVGLNSGTNNIGSVNIGSAIPSGSNVIGNVGISGPVPAGSNIIGAVTQSGSWSISSTVSVSQSGSWTVAATQSGTWTVNASITASLPSGTNTIGAVNQAGTWNINTVTTLGGITSALPAGANNIGVVTPAMNSGGNINLTTSSTSGAYVAFSSQTCKQLTIFNDTGTKLEFQQGGAGVALPIFDQTYYTIYGITNANQIGIRRKDGSTTTVVASARWES